MGALEHRGGIDADAVAERGGRGLHLAGEPGEGAPQDLVIVASEGVARHIGSLRIGQYAARVTGAGRPVIHARAQHTHGAGRQLLRPAAHRSVPLHVVHLAMEARVQPGEQVLLVRGNLDPGHAQGAEAQGARALLKLQFERLKSGGGKLRHGATTPHSIMSPMALPVAMYSTAQVRALDAHAIESGVAGYTLMKRAGEAALRFLRTRWPMAHRIVIVCGSGNNGGDGYVLARFAQATGLTVTVLAAGAPEKLQGDARQAYADFRSSGGVVQPFDAEQLAAGEVIVDALLGIGLKGDVRADLSPVIRAINQSGRPVFALDVPSGLDGDAGTVLGEEAIRAEATVTFVGLKTGLFVGDGPEFTGTIFCDDLEISPAPSAQPAPRLTRIVESEIHEALPRRPRSSNKGDFGRVLIIGSGPGMPGAARLAGEACLRVGAGLTTVAVAPENVAPISAGRPELICIALSGDGMLAEAAGRADVIAVGPGLGRSAWARGALAVALESGKPLVVDADALNLLAEERIGAREDWILTPHPGEAGRLLGVSAQDIQHDRLAALDRLLERFHGTIVLKGAGTLVGARGRTPGVCERGNPGMATAGTGDVLTGAIAGILAQCHDHWAAARVGVLVHAMAGDAAARAGERGVLALDLTRELHHCVNL